MSNEKTIFAEALAIAAPDDRKVFLDRVCGDNAALRAEVETLLAAHEAAAASFLESPPPGLAPTTAGTDSAVDLAGATIGHYKLLERIGEGGMGVVYMAEQLRPIKRRVAMKIIKPGLDTKQTLARFEAERQALAMMDHPSIAKVFDAGATDTGRSYFVMELVRGVPITEYCDQHHLTPRQRLELFVQVCRAVQHAHQKGIIHRDLKPNNVLVTLSDNDKPIPKVIDFGIAKATGEQRLTDRTLFTEFRQLLGTPLYMSPEQAEMSQLTDVDTRSDVYSLGMLLYELLTGTTPFDKQRLAKAAYDEVRRIIREEEPPRPSTRLSTLGETITTISAQRQSDPKRLSQIVRGELDWIVMKALEKERTRRYETANALARDVERYLADVPVEACPPTRMYRLGKFARRNRAAMAVCVLLAAAVLIALGGVAGGIGWAIRDRAEREHQFALQRAAQQERVSTQLNAILDEVARRENDQKWSEALIAARRAEPALASGEAATDVEQRMRRALADLQLVHRLEATRAQSGMAWGLSDFDHAEGKLPYQAEKEYSAAFRDAGIDVDVLPAEESGARILSRRAVSAAVLPAMDDWVAVRQALKNSGGVDRLNAVLRRADPDPWRQQVRDAMARNDWAAILALAKSPDVDRQPAATISFLAGAIWQVGRPFGSERYELQVDLLRRAQSRYPSDFWINHRLGVDLVFNGPKGVPEGMSYLRAAVAVRPDSGHAVLNLGNGYDALGQPEQAIACFRKAIELAPTSAVCYYNLGNALTNQDRYREAIDALEKCIRCDADNQSSHQHALGELVVCYTALHQPQRATECEQRLRTLVRATILKDLPRTLPADAGQASDQLRRGAKCYTQLGDFAKAKENLSESLRLHALQIARAQLACIELYLGNEQAYSDLRDRILAGDTSTTQYKLQIAETGLLRPASAEQLSDAGKWIEAGSTAPPAATAPSTSPASQPKTVPPVQLLLAKGMLDYRRGDLQSASKRLLQCIHQFNNFGPGGGQGDQGLEWAITAELYLTMCQYRLSQPAEAEDSLSDARKLVQLRLGPLMYGRSEYGSLDWLIAHIAAREAEATIHPHPTAATAPASQP